MQKNLYLGGLWMLLNHEGDWHSDLMFQLNRAEEGTSVDEVRTAVQHLRQLLSRKDECIHAVTVQQEIPADLDARNVFDSATHVLKGAEFALELLPARVITLSLTWRGDVKYVKLVADRLLSQGISRARCEQRGPAHYS